MTKVKEIKIKKSDSKSEGKEIEEIMNSITDKKIETGDLPSSTSHVLVQDFAGKVLRRTKSVFISGTQYFVKAGTKWEDVDKFARKQISFSDADFE